MSSSLLVTVRLGGDEATDVAVEADPAATVGAVAEALGTALELPTPPRPTLSVPDAGVLRSDQPLADAPIRNGDTVEVVASSDDAAHPDLPAALVEVISGPLVGTRVPLPEGQSTIGRSSRCDVVLRDAAISAVHARLTVADRLIVEDLGSTNGTTVSGGDEIEEPTILGPMDTVEFGSTAVMVTRPTPRAGGREVFVRSPRAAAPIEPKRFKVEVPPAPAPKRRIPLITSLAPLAMAGVTYAMTSNLASLLIALLSPVIGFASFIESRMHGRSQFRADAGAWRVALSTAVESLAGAQQQELERSRALYPDVFNLHTLVATRDPITWSRAAEHDDLLRLRIGTGRVASIHGLELPERSAGSDLMADAVAARKERLDLRDAPVTIDFDSLGVVGLTGAASDEIGYERKSLAQELTARSLVLQAAMMVGPGHLNIVAFVPERELERWDWLKWLPHTRRGLGLQIATEANATEALAGLAELISQRLEARGSAGDAPRPLPRVLVVAAENANLSRPRFSTILSRGPAAGVVTCWIGSSRNLLPEGCRAVVDHGLDGTGSLELVESGTRVDGVILEGVGLNQADKMARALAPLVDATASSADAGIPSLVRMSDLGDDMAHLEDAVSAQARWSQSRSLGAPVGIAEGGPFEIDLRVDGPHGLVAGTTGAGKSEFLQSLIAALAMRHPPTRLNFLLVDYKGGAAFREAGELPHTVGFVTDLDDHLVRRSLVALGAELTRREHLLNLAAAKDLASMEASGHPETPPNLVIVVDEFAALAGEVPEFVDGIVDIAQRGRSLGLHLLLATQRPAGVVTDYIRANTNLRVALRVASDDESVDVIGSKDAAQISRGLPGRAVARIGPTELITFQSAFVGARQAPESTDEISVSVFRFEVGGSMPLLVGRPPQAPADAPTDLQRIVATLSETHHASGRPDPRRPWLSPLTDLYTISELPGSDSAARLVIGLGDHPEEQDQRPAVANLDAGHLLIIGASRSGKTVGLRTFAAALQQQEAEAAWIYGLDCAGRGLAMISDFPSVGAVVLGDDRERVRRLFRTIGRIIDDRIERMGAAAAQDLEELRRRSADDEPRIVVLVDGLHAFLADYETFEGGKWVDMLGRLMADGLASGVHFVVAGDRRGGIPTRVLSQFQQLLCLRLANEDDYLTVDLPRGSLTPDSPAGRGFLNGEDIQLAILGASAAGDAQSRAVEELVRTASAPAVAPPEIRALPERVELTAVPAMEGMAVIGVGDDDLGPAGFTPGDGLFGIFGARSSGRTTALLAAADAVRRLDPGIPTLLVARADPAPARFGSWTRVEANPDGAVELIDELANRAGEAVRFAVFVDDFTDHVGTPFESALARLLPATRVASALIVVSGDAASVRSAYGSETLAAVKRGKSGLLLMPDPTVDGDTLGVTLPRRRIRNVPGRGYLVTRGAVDLIQTATTADA